MLIAVHVVGLSAALLGWLLFSRASLPVPPWVTVLLAATLLPAIVLIGLQSRALHLPVYALVGGLLGLLVVLGTLFAIQRLGVVGGLALIIFAELIGATLTDSFGWFGRTPLPLNPLRLGGLLLVAFGALLALKGSA